MGVSDQESGLDVYRCDGWKWFKDSTVFPDRTDPKHVGEISWDLSNIYDVLDLCHGKCELVCCETNSLWLYLCPQTK